MITDPLDPLTWVLRLRQVQLRFQGYRRRCFRMDGAPFGTYVRRGAEGTCPLLFLHGLALFPEWWYPLLGRLPRTRPVAVPELLGFGRSPGRTLDPRAFDLELYLRQVRRVKEALGWEKVILCGVSLGGWVAAHYALAHAGEVQGLILYGPGGLTPGVTEEELRELRDRFDYRTPEAFVRLMNDLVFLKPRPIPRFVGRLAVRRSQRNGHKHLLQNLELAHWIGERAREIQAPTALLWGRQDRVFPFSAGEALVRIMPRARLFPLEDTAHSYLFERPGSSCRAFFEALAYVEEREGSKDPRPG